ncbi:MAG: hypothetical protein C4527_04685 [Candidatus Omnitrophota bacterium]|jgi:L-fucose isomerase-like protein|nr:MAG: hypothetical protein C4527_04685 [Candidatus Omnitrophota bacterium]
MTNVKSDFNSFSRRTFLAGCSTCAIASAAVHAASSLSTLTRDELIPNVKTKVRIVYSHSNPETPIWPNIGYDFEARKKELTRQLQDACPEIEFLPVTIQSEEQVKQLLENDRDIDGYVCFILGLGEGLVSPRTILDSGRPVVLADDLYGGTGRFLGEYGRAYRNGLKVVGISSSNIRDVADAARCFAAMKKLKHSKILDFTLREKDRLWGNAKIEDFENLYGTKIEVLKADVLNEAYNHANQEQAQAWAKQWIRKARKVVEPSEEEIIKSAAMYLALQNLLRKHGAQAVAIDCLGLFYSQNMFAYPCLGFFQLNNDGLIGACESDLFSTITMLIMNYLIEKPGYISDPVIDVSKNQIIYAHCVAMTKVHGSKGKSNPYDIRDHSEDRKGAAIRSLMPLGEMTTTLIFRPDKKIVVMHRGKTVENIDEDKACRTKLAVELDGDIQKLLKGWDHGWHRVTFYGDHQRIVEQFAALNGIEVIREA